jgi:hypothetical protein
MKKNMRRRRGAVLGLVAACTLVFVVLGIAFFFLAKIMGGGREVAHTTDSGILNVCKQALLNPGVNASGTDFAFCGIPVGSPITLYSYNKCVAQAIIVALNAQASGTTTGATHAAAVLAQLKSAIGQPLRSELMSGSGGTYNYQSAFAALANLNNTRMDGNNTVQAPGYATAFMRGGTSILSTLASSNLYFYTSEFPAAQLSPITFNNASTFKPTDPGATNYVAGYKPITITLPGVGALNYMTVPLFPQQTPHLVSGLDFGNSSASPDPATLPNAMKINSQSFDSTAQVFGGAVACAIVGAVDQGYGAQVPGGYIEVFNRPGQSLTGLAPTDNSNNIFNNEMFGAPGVSLSVVPGGPNGTEAIFSNAPSVSGNPNLNLIDDWNSFNLGTGPNPGYGAGTTDGAIWIATSPTSAGTVATASQLAQLKQIIAPNYTSAPTNNCLSQMNTQGFVSGNCLTWMPTIALTYGRTLPGGSVNLATMGPVFSNVDAIKETVIQEFESRVQRFTVQAPSGPTYPDNASMNGSTGMGQYITPAGQTGAAAKFPSPFVSMPIEKPNSPWTYLTQIDSFGGGCGTSTVFNKIVQRCQEIQPAVTTGQVQALLQSNTLPMGTKLYIYLPGANTTLTGPFGGLTMDIGPPPGFSGQLPDGQPINPLTHCQCHYNLINQMIDVQRDPPVMTMAQINAGAMGITPVWQADLNLHDQPYSQTTPTGAMDLSGYDHALWQDSSGYGNLLGHLEFANTVQGGDQFAAPN